jgi:hypothetical protein
VTSSAGCGFAPGCCALAMEKNESRANARKQLDLIGMQRSSVNAGARLKAPYTA